MSPQHSIELTPVKVTNDIYITTYYIWWPIPNSHLDLSISTFLGATIWLFVSIHIFDIVDHDKGIKGKLRVKHKVIPRPPLLWYICDMPQALLDAQEQRKGKNKWLTDRDHSLQDLSLYQFATILMIYKKKGNLQKLIDSTSPSIVEVPSPP